MTWNLHQVRISVVTPNSVTLTQIVVSLGLNQLTSDYITTPFIKYKIILQLII